MDMVERITAGGFGDTISVFYGKDHEVWVRGGGPGPEYEDCSLYDFIRRIAKVYGVEVEPNNEDLDWQMHDMLADGAETKEGLLALLYAGALEATEMRERLREIEEVLCGDKAGFDLDRLRELTEADKAGRCMVLPVKPGDKIWQICLQGISYNGVSYNIEEHVIDKILVTPIGLSYEFWIPGFGLYRTSPGEAVFFTHEEAEAALEKMKEGAHGNKRYLPARRKAQMGTAKGCRSLRPGDHNKRPGKSRHERIHRSFGTEPGRT